VLSAERVEVSARSSNRTADSGVSTANAARHRPSAGRWPGSPPARSPAGQRVGQHCLRLVKGRHSRSVASVEPLSDQPCYLLGLHRLRSTGHLTTFSEEGRAAIHLPCRPGPAGAWAGGGLRPRRTTTGAWNAPAVRPICRFPKQAQTHHLAPTGGDSKRAADRPQSQCVVRPPARRPTGSPNRYAR